MKIDKKITAQDSENLGRYFADVRQYAPLTKEEEKKLIVKIQKNNDAKALDILLKANLRFVISVAKKYQNQGVPLLDLISEGNAGMVEAAKRFDVSKDIKFFSYAVWWIRIKIFTSMDLNNRVIQLPANRTLLVTRVKKIIQELEQKLGRYPTLDELSVDIPEYTEQEIQEAIIYGGVTRSINDKVPNASKNGDEDMTLEDLMPGDKSMAVDEIDRVESLVNDLNRFLYHLTQYEYDVMILSLGLNSEPVVRNIDIAKALKLKEKDIIKIKAKAIKRLRKLKNIGSLEDYL